MTIRAVRGAAAALLVAAALTGCTDAPPLTNTAVLTVNETRDRYLDALCPLRADAGFWRPVDGDGRASAEALLRTATPAVAGLAEPPKPYPRLIRPAMTRLIAVLRGNVAYFEAVRDAPDAAAVAALTPPSAVPDGVLAEVESRVTASSAPGAGSCTGHLPSASATPSTSASPS